VRRIGRTWYIRFPLPDGDRVERSTDATSKTEALTLLNREIERIWGRRGAVKSVLVPDLLRLIEADYRHKGQNLRYIARRWAHLEPVFGPLQAHEVTTEHLARYVELRRSDEAAASTIQQELACLRRMLRLGMAATPRLVESIPAFPSVRIDNARQNFFEADTFRRVVAELPAHLRPLVTVAYWTGWRRSELLSLRWSQVDLKEGTVRLYPGTTKNRMGRVVVLPEPALKVLKTWRRSTPLHVPWVFHRNGKQIRSYYKVWRSACERAGCPGAWMHDFRRTAVRNYTRAGVPDVVAMRISGHKTRSIFDRYNIVSVGDLEAAARAVADSPTVTQRSREKGRAK
jgi:integrase